MNVSWKAISFTFAVMVFMHGLGCQQPAAPNTPGSDSGEPLQAAAPDKLVSVPPAPTPKPSTSPAESAAPPAIQTPSPAPAPPTAVPVAASQAVTEPVPGPVDVADTAVNLVPNGDFNEWPDGIRVPLEWTHAYGYTLEKMPSTISAYSGTTYDNWKAVEQTWRESDGADSVLRQFGVNVKGLAKDTDYRLSFKAKNPGGVTAVVAVWGIIDEKKSKVERIASPLIQLVQSENFRDYSAVFNSGSFETIRIVTACPKAKFPATVIWDRFELHANAADTSNLLANGSIALWPDGVRLPTEWTHGFGYSVDDIPSQVERYEDGVPLAGFGVLQTWNKPDANDSIFRQFGQTVKNVKPKTLYRVRVKALNLSDKAALVSVWDVSGGENGPVKKLAEPFIQAKPSAEFGFLDYTAVFDSGSASAVRIVTLSQDAGTKVVWAGFELLEVGPAK
ncbi:MAG: hypothetical protein K1Y02_22900 [Candidatus Hydrogenedentes bacterium]|nr:hypothetical protein [Candidatus Hydrogenedentota bacterium]